MLVTGKADFTAVMEKHTIILGILRMVDGQPAIERIDETIFTGQVRDSDALAEKVAMKTHKGAQVMEHKKEERLFTMTADKFLSNAVEGDVPEYRK